MANTKYLKNEAGRIFIWTEKLAEVEGMKPCDAKGNLIDVAEEQVDPSTEPGAGQSGSNNDPDKNDSGNTATLDDFKIALEDMKREELVAKANELEVQFQQNIGEEKLRERILAEIEARLSNSQGD